MDPFRLYRKFITVKRACLGTCVKTYKCSRARIQKESVEKKMQKVTEWELTQTEWTMCTHTQPRRRRRKLGILHLQLLKDAAQVHDTNGTT